jgi:hypothetical protein
LRYIQLPQFVRIAIAAGVLSAVSLPSTFAQEVDDAEARNQETWRETIAQTAVPAEGCFHASYPSLTWSQIECAVAPDVELSAQNGQISQTIGSGNDYAAEVTSGLIAKTVGSFPKVTGVKKEKGMLGANDYSLQLNSNLMKTEACDGAADPKQCRGWQQFVYGTYPPSAYMQYWLINWNNDCPSGWTIWPGSGDCAMNSAAVNVPLEVIS